MEAKETKQMAGMETEEACCRTKRTPAEQKKLLTRLKTVEGQIRGIQKMVEADAYYVCRSVYFGKETGKSRFTEKFSFIQDGRMTERSCRFAFSIRYFVCI